MPLVKKMLKANETDAGNPMAPLPTPSPKGGTSGQSFHPGAPYPNAEYKC